MGSGQTVVFVFRTPLGGNMNNDNRIIKGFDVRIKKGQKRNTTVSGNRDEIDAVRNMGYTMTDAFVLGCKVILGTCSSNLEEKKRKLEELEGKKDTLDSQINALKEDIENAEMQQEQVQNEYVNTSYNFDDLVEEFFNCKFKIKVDKKYNLIGHLSDISGISKTEIKKFYERKKVTRAQVQEFLENNLTDDFF